MDHHYYQAWIHGKKTVQEFCDDYEGNAANADNSKYEVWFGEWALATDTCAHWLGGFNDGNNSPEWECRWVDCPRSYLPDGIAVDFDRDAPILGPFGSGWKDWFAIHKGKCSTDSTYFNETQVRDIAKCALASYDKHLNGTFLWTAHNEIEEKWDYIKAWDLMWINKTEVPESQQLHYDDIIAKDVKKKKTYTLPVDEEFIQ